MLLQLNVAILGSGNIGIDLLVKVMRSKILNIILISGRDEKSKGLDFARNLGVKTYFDSVDAIVRYKDKIDIVFDATSAMAHINHINTLQELDLVVIDMTPSRIGEQIVPTLNLEKIKDFKDINMISCGGQASIPIINIMKTVNNDIEYVEVVSSIASNSAGIATRENVSEYIDVTQKAINSLCGIKNSKTILIVNPASPCVNMQVSICANISKYNKNEFLIEYEKVIKQLQKYIPGYKIVVPPIFKDGKLFTMISVDGQGDYLPKYAGNLDIINCAAIFVAENIAKGLVNG